MVIISGVPIFRIFTVMAFSKVILLLNDSVMDTCWPAYQPLSNLLLFDELNQKK